VSPPDLEIWRWCIAGIAALLVGMAKVGLPGLGILVVPLMALAFGSRDSVGTLLPLLITADIFAVAYHRRHAEWDKVLALVPWVGGGLLAGFLIMWGLGEADGVYKPILGAIILCMLGLLLLRRALGERLTPRGRITVGFTGLATGIATFLANAAGPVMSLYLAGMGMPKERFMGTNAWFFLIMNLVKIPMFLVIGLLLPSAPLIDAESLSVNLILAPVVIAGVPLGALLFKLLPQKVFDAAVLTLAGLAAITLIL
jgi:uncharacterized membrane protein YfcA